jgi:DNA-binding LytR/AlgR family response regulator
MTQMLLVVFVVFIVASNARLDIGLLYQTLNPFQYVTHPLQVRPLVDEIVRLRPAAAARVD